MTSGLISVTSPTKPSSGSLATARIRPASMPLSPTAYRPWTLIAATSCGLTWPFSTIRAISTVLASVTRRPSTNVVSMPRRAISSEICGPPPCTTTGRMPTSRISTMSSANDASASWSEVPASALPPYFTTTVLPAKRRMYGRASTSVAAFKAAGPAEVSVGAVTGRGRSTTGRRSRRGRARRSPPATLRPTPPS